MKALQQKAEVLIEALPYLRKFAGKTVVIKYGGAAMVDQGLRESVAQDLVLLKTVGLNPVVVHGGGPEISAAMKASGKAPVFKDGLRVTDAETMAITEMVLVGKINTQITGFMNQHGRVAAGLSGKDGHLLEARKLKGKVDLGYVGEVVKVNTEILEALESRGFIPIIAPVAMGRDGQAYNCNADLVAGAVAAALKAEKLVMMTDQPGLLRDVKDPGSLIASVKAGQVAGLKKKGVIDKGMLPKMEACLTALKAGCGKVHIIDGRVHHALLLEIFTDSGIGTEIVRG
ncbi:MAG TPA: acetylglutamate kinase [bacterium]|nr:acetylglutamate kinase [bacterium]